MIQVPARIEHTPEGMYAVNARGNRIVGPRASWSALGRLARDQGFELTLLVDEMEEKKTAPTSK